MLPFGIDVVLVCPGFVRTAMLSDSLHDERQRLFEALPEDVKRAYGEQFAQETRRKLELAMKDSYSTEEAVDQLFYAVSARWPRAYVFVGWKTRLVVLLFAVLPTFLLDWLMHRELGGAVAWKRRP